MSKWLYNFKDMSHEEIIEFALNQPKDIEHSEYGELVRELGTRLKKLKKSLDRF